MAKNPRMNFAAIEKNVLMKLENDEGFSPGIGADGVVDDGLADIVESDGLSLHLKYFARGACYGNDHPCDEVDDHAGPEVGADCEDYGEDAHHCDIPAEILGEAGKDTAENSVAHVAVELLMDWRRGCRAVEGWDFAAVGLSIGSRF